MAKQTVKTSNKKTTVTIKAKSSSSSGNTMKCNICGGTGMQKKPSKKK